MSTGEDYDRPREHEHTTDPELPPAARQEMPEAPVAGGHAQGVGQGERDPGAEALEAQAEFRDEKRRGVVEGP